MSCAGVEEFKNDAGESSSEVFVFYDFESFFVEHLLHGVKVESVMDVPDLFTMFFEV